MASDGFKHITVTAADDDEVIVAGVHGQAEPVREPESGREPEPGREPESEPEPERQPEPEPERQPEAAASSADFEPRSISEPPAAPAPAPAPAPAAPAASPAPAAKAKQPAGRAGDAYRETTLEDLESQPMPFMQKAVIVAAVVCIIGALVYYFVAMR